MRKHIWMLALVVSVLGLASAALAQEDLPVGEDVALEPEEPYVVTAGLLHRIYVFNHSSLQRRSDMEFDNAEDYRDGDTDGSGWGLVYSIGRGTGNAVVTFLSTDYNYELLYTAGGEVGSEVDNVDAGSPDVDPAVPAGGHRIETQRRDLDLVWQEVSGNNSRGFWGWKVGYRYVGVNNDITLAEQGTRAVNDTGDITWHLLQGGYFGTLDAFGAKYVSIHGGLNGFLGEASGLARSGNDTLNNGVISERYNDEYSVAYGSEMRGAVTIHFLKNLNMTIDYSREWLYSFKATDTGTVVFPDNNDALFIENSERVTGTLAYIF